MRKILILSLLVFTISCKKEKPLSKDIIIEKNDIVIEKDDVVNEKNNDETKTPYNEVNGGIEKKVVKVIPKTISNIETAVPKIISLNSEHLEYFDLDKNKVLKVDLNTLKEEVSFVPDGGGYLYFYKNTANYRAVSNGWESNVTTRIKTKDEELVFSNSMILDCSNEELIFTGVSEGIDADNKTHVYNLTKKNQKSLKIKADECRFIDETTLLILRRFPEQQVGELIIYNLEDDSYKTILNNFSANNFIKYLKKEKVLYFVTNGLVSRLSLETNKIKVVYEKSIYLPYIINDSILTGYAYDKDNKKRNLVFISLDQ